MIWKRSTIKDIDYTFPSGLAKLILEKGEVIVESGHGMNMLMCVFDPGGTHEIEFLIGKDMIYCADDQNILVEFFPVAEWKGPEINPGEELEYEPPTDADEILNVVSEMNDKALYPTDLKEAIIGYVERFGMEPLILLDKSKCLKIYMERDGMSYEEAIEFFDFNVIGAWMGEGTPCFATLPSTSEGIS